MAHLNYLIYCECFPNSIGDFDCESFKKRDCELIYKWFVGKYIRNIQLYEIFSILFLISLLNKY